MKKTVFISLFVFSLALNLAVAATLGLHLWQENRAQGSTNPRETSLSDEDLRQIRSTWMAGRTRGMMETRRKIMDKQLELLDEIGKDPGRPEVAATKLNELTALKAEIEKLAVARISNTLSELPPEKRQAFITFLKTRSCMGPGMPMRGRGGMGRCPVQVPVGE
jgi:hypothetical protein